MDRSRLLFVALLASVALNGVLLARGPAAVTATTATTAPATPDAATRAEAPRFVWPPVVLAAHGTVDGGVAARPIPAGPVDVTLQQDVLCTIAEDKLREGWRQRRDAIAADLRRSLADDGEQTRNVAENAARIADTIGLPAEQRAAFADRYRERRLARVAEAGAALAREPADYAGLYAAARGLFADEDALALELGGDTARERLRVEDLEIRTTFLATTAAMADAPFESLSW